jgi:hypothetical protein
VGAHRELWVPLTEIWVTPESPAGTDRSPEWLWLPQATTVQSPLRATL